MATAARVPEGLESTEGAPAVARPRLDSIDLLRGLVMVVMALDHVRDFFHIDNRFFQPADLARTTPVLFFTRWITHFCAPTFVFLAGTGAFLWAARGRSRGELTRFLVTRGIWLVIIELTVVKVAWSFNLSFDQVGLQVIWAIGWSMVLLGLLVWLPLPAVGAIGVLMIAGHNLLDGIAVHPLAAARLGAQAPSATAWDWFWSIVHVQNPPVIYPLVPWVGVMAAGYAFGSVMRRPARERQAICLWLGLALTTAFVVIRAINRYGDPSPWSVQRDGVYTLLSFLNTTKYPPSLLYLLMTLGPAIAALALFDRAKGPVVRFFVVYGRVPFLFYVAHLFLIHAVVLAAAAITGQVSPRALMMHWVFFPKEFGFGLGTVYLIWIGVVLALYPLCRRFAALKARRKDAWLSYV